MSEDVTPARDMAKLVVSEQGESLSSMWWRHVIVADLLDCQDRENADRPDFTPAISREMAESAIGQLFAIYDCRSSDFAGAYAWMGLWSALGIDFFASKLVFKPRDSNSAGEDASASPIPS
jgi:hypothetical protein